MAQNKLFVSGIGTNVGKTVVSAILCEAFNADYWKPIQAGDLDHTDSDKIRILANKKEGIIAEKYRFKKAASPHFAASLEHIKVSKEDLILPESQNKLIVEGAGGLMVPINNEGLLYIDIIKQWKIPVVLVSRHYLGSINHTLMSLEILKLNKIELRALIFVGDENKATEEAILQRFEIKNVHRIPETEVIDRSFIKDQAKRIAFDFN